MFAGPSLDKLGTSLVTMGPWRVGLRIYLHFRLSKRRRGRKVVMRIVAVTYPLTGDGFDATMVLPRLYPLVARKLASADERFVIFHQPRRYPLPLPDERGRTIYHSDERWWQAWPVEGGDPARPVYRIVEIDRRAVECITGSPWLPVADGVSIAELNREALARSEREARMYHGDMRHIETMRAVIERRHHHFVNASAHPGTDGWYYSETRDRHGHACIASGMTLDEWEADFLGASACPEYPPAVGDGMTINYRRATLVCSVAEVADSGETIVLREDTPVAVNNDTLRPVHRFVPNPDGALRAARWDARSRCWVVFEPGLEPVPVGYGRERYRDRSPLEILW